MRLELFDTEAKGYSLSHLLDEENSALVADFSVPNEVAGLEHYLKTSALQDEKRNHARTYLVKDDATGEAVCYFSLRTGLITAKSFGSNGETFDTIPAIELSNFAVNSNYRKNHPAASKFGFMVFNNFIFPLVQELAKFVGVNSLYIYALPNERLIEHYQTFGFHRLSSEDEKFVYNHVKPEYDEGCIFMYQTV